MSSATAHAGDVRSSGNIFISYNRQDRDFRTQLEGLLIDEGYDPKVDVEDIASGEAWRRRLEEMVGASDTFIVILTDNWVASENCRSEFEIAREKGKRIISVLPRPLTEAGDAGAQELEVRAALLQNQNIHFFPLREGDGGGFYRGMNELKRFLRDGMDQLRLRRLYEQRARAWADGEDDLLSGDQLTQAETWLKKERASHGVAGQIETYIVESRKARERAVRAQRRTRTVLGALVGLLIAAALFVTYQVYQQRIIQTDAENLIAAAPAWAAGKAELASLNIDSAAGDAAQADGGQAEWRKRLAVAIEQLTKGLDTVRKIQQDSAKPLVLEIGLDLASAHYNNDDLSKSEELLESLDSEAAFSAAERRAVRLMASAVIACQGGADKAALVALLESAPDDVKAQYSTDRAGQWSKPRPTCDAAREAICAFDATCQQETFVAAIDEETDARVPQAAETEAPSDAAPDDIVLADEPAPAHPEIAEVMLHISKEADRQAARELAQMLAGANYRVLGIELIEAPDGRNRSVRYYYDDQQAAADDLIDFCARSAATIVGKAGWANRDTYRLISLVGRYDNLPRTRVEIWL